jgi:hypothetical protein
MLNCPFDSFSGMVIPTIGMLLSNLHVQFLSVSVFVVCSFMTELNIMLKSARRNEGTAKPTVVNAPSKGLEDMCTYRSQKGFLYPRNTQTLGKRDSTIYAMFSRTMPADAPMTASALAV